MASSFCERRFRVRWGWSDTGGHAPVPEVDLKRKSFLAAMQAIRTYVTGLHRVADDLELAYTLFVASIESLAEDFDGSVGHWSDYEDSKRHRIDRALADADEVTAEKVRTALVEIEHLALSRRFRDFSLDHISRSALREPGRVGAPGCLDLRAGLKEAYGLRSRYLHSLKDLSKLLDSHFSYSETVRSGHATFLPSRTSRCSPSAFSSRFMSDPIPPRATSARIWPIQKAQNGDGLSLQATKRGAGPNH